MYGLILASATLWVFVSGKAFVVFTEEEPKCIGSAPCIRFDRCPGISGPDLIENLTQNQCGFDGSIPLICCQESDLNAASAPEAFSVFSNEDQETSVLPRDCGRRKETPDIRIVGGDLAIRGAWPWLAHLRFKNALGATWRCGGSLINDQFVITAAHCIKGMAPEVEVRLGEHAAGSEEDFLSTQNYTANVTVHENFDWTSFENDVALLKLDRKVQYTNRIQPICLPYKSDLASRDETDVSGWVAGWGVTRESGKASNVLRQVLVPIVDSEECAKKYQVTPASIDEKVFCAGTPGKDSCQGDSGGPFMINNEDDRFEMIGLVSFGIGCARTEFPGVYQRISEYMDWIMPKIQPTA